MCVRAARACVRASVWCVVCVCVCVCVCGVAAPAGVPQGSVMLKSQYLPGERERESGAHLN